MAKDEVATTDEKMLTKADLDKAGGLARPNWMGERKVEAAGENEIELPRLAIAQGLSPEITPDSSVYIDGLKLFDMFNTLFSTNYGREPIRFIPIGHSTARRIEFRPRKEGGGIIDMNVPPGDSRMNWTRDESGKDIPPRATKFIEFVVLLFRPNHDPEPIVISIKATNKFNTRTAKRLDAFIDMRQDEAIKGLYKISSKSEKNDKGAFGVFVVENAGWVQDERMYKAAKKFRDSLEGKTITVQRDETETESVAEDDSFDIDENDNVRI